MLPAERIAELKEHVRSLPHPEEALVDVMHELQDACGHMTDEAVEAAADIAGVSTIKVEGLATFYNLFYRRPVGRKVIHVCDSISCWVVGMEDVFAYLTKKLGVELGGTTEDGAFTLLPICCLGACHEAPAMMIGETIYGNLTPARIDEILEKERQS
ncbi:MAG TPA: NADH-quinone oxidoreductase subunit NuoE [Nitrospirota bacterium]|jgi:NADH-quinone oxidoreductase subunit E